ncbi:MAG: PD40 domain-containing protein [Bacteroidales bacterium]|nr:PD40 domain-containing protein [Bacteroidales bacterium]
MVKYFNNIATLVTLLFFLTGNPAFSQLHSKSKKAISHYNLALQTYRLMDYQKAEEEMEQALKIDPDFIEVHLLQAEVFTEQKNYEKAISSYAEVVRIDPDFFWTAWYNMGRLEVLTGKYDAAKVHLETFLSVPVKSKSLLQKAQKNLNICEFALKAMKKPVPFQPVNIGNTVNTQYDEYWPSLTADNQTLVITRLEPVSVAGRRKKVENFFVSTWGNDGWTMAKKMRPPVNTDRNEGAQSLSADGHFMFFTACNRPEGRGSCDIYFSSKLGGNWSFPANLESPVNTSAWEAQPSVSSDGKTLYFVSNRPGGIGKMDIWRTTLTDEGKWGEPENLGPRVNSLENEMSPFIHKDMHTLYFSSDGWVGMGGYDLFISRFSEDSIWSEPENLGYPINTWSDEIGMIVTADGKKAFFSSAIGDSTGKDIYEFDLYSEIRPDPVSYIKGKVFDSETKAPLMAVFELINLENGETSIRAFSDNNGEFLVSLPTDKNYALNVSKEAYLFYSDNFALKGIKEISDPFYMDIPLHPVKVGEKGVLRNIFFKFDSFELEKESLTELNKLLGFIQSNPGIKIEIQGYTDDQGTPSYNLILSQKRVREVYNFLLINGVNKESLSYKGFGEAKPVASNETEAGRAKNRRIEFLILEVGEIR